MGFPCHLCDPTQPKGRKEENAGTPSTAGVDSKGGERPLLWRFFPQFLIAEKLGPAPARSPRLAGLAAQKCEHFQGFSRLNASLV